MSERKSALQRELGQTRPFISLAQEATISILRTADVVRRRLASVIEPYGVTYQQYNVLRILRGSHPDPLPTLEIGERLIEQVPGITRLLDRLEEKGLVRRERSADDRRLVHCWITQEALDLLAAMDAEVDQADEESVSGLTAEEAGTIVRLLNVVRDGRRRG